MSQQNIGSQAEAGRYTHPAFRMLEPFITQQAIDLTAFIGQWPTRLQLQATAADLSIMADRLGLDGVCVSHMASVFGFDTRTGNEALFQEVSADSRLLPVPILNPAEPAWEYELEWAAKKGARGVRIVPGYHNYSLLHPELKQLAGKLVEKRIPLHVSARLEDQRLQHPRLTTRAIPFEDLADLLRLYEELPVVISGLRAYEWSKIQEVLNSGHQTDNVLLDLWFTNGPLAAISALCKQGERDLFAYGSCTPLQITEATVLQLASAEISEEDRAVLCRTNALRLLGSNS